MGTKSADSIEEDDEVDVVASYQEFHVHDHLLIRRSPKFAALLEDSKKGVLQLPEKNPITFQLLLDYLYCDEVNLTSSNVSEIQDLMCLAQEFEVPRLKMICELKLICLLTPKNVLDIRKQADKMGAELLKTKCFDFMVQNLWILSTEKDFKENVDKDLLLEVMGSATKNISNKRGRPRKRKNSNLV